MNVLYVTYHDVLGQQFNGYVLHRELNMMGHQSHMAVAESGFCQPNIHQVGGQRINKINRHLSRIEQRFSLYSVLPISAASLYVQQFYRSADIVHLQLVYGVPFFSLFNLPIMSRQHHLVWTIHDPWMTTGHCIHPFDCDLWLTGCSTCPDLSRYIPIKRDASSLSWRLKHWIMHHSNVSLVVASKWMYDRVRKSPILSHLPCHVIPFGIDVKVFGPRDKAACRKQLGIPPEAKVIAFRCTVGRFDYKGMEYIQRALELLDFRDVYVLTFDEKRGFDSLRERYHFVELGFVNDPNAVANALNAADIFLMPSTAEAFGMMAIESMACGTPVVVFDGTSLPDVIHSPKGGLAVPYKDSTALAKAVQMLFANRMLYEEIVAKGLEIVAKEYTVDLYVKRHLELYETLLSQN
jgi:glycosyltransferase involved in cell wall biosynthesis